MLAYPEKRYYKYIIKTKYGSIILDFNQATAKETLEFRKHQEEYKDILSLPRYMYKDFMVSVKKWKVGYKKKWYIPKQLVWLLFRINWVYYFLEISTIIHKSYTSIFEGYGPCYPVDHKTNPFDHSILYLAERTNSSVNDVLDIITYEQMLYLYDMSRWEFNESFPRGQAQNTMIRAEYKFIKNSDQEFLDYYKAYKKRTKNKLKNSKKDLVKKAKKDGT